MTQTPPNGAVPLDGNAEGGLLSELFALDVTAAEITCAGCGAVAAIGAIRVYAPAMGAVFRCAHCDTVVLRLTPDAGGPVSRHARRAPAVRRGAGRAMTSAYVRSGKKVTDNEWRRRA